MELAASARPRPAADGVSSSRRMLEADAFAWVAAVPCTLLTIAVLIVLGPALGRLLFAPTGDVVFVPGTLVAPEPTEHARYAFALLGAFALAALVAAGRRRPALPARTARVLVAGAQAFAGAWLVAGFVAQERVFHRTELQANRMFTPRTLVAAAVLAALPLVVLRRDVVARAADRVLRRETRPRAAACALLAALLTAVWLSTAINTEATVNGQIGSNLIPWDMDETFAILDGRTPLVDFHAMYAQLWHYVAAAAIALAGDASLAFWTTTMATISGVALLAVYAVFRRLLRSSLPALLLYLPFLATTFFVGLKPLDRRFSPAGIFSAWPLRYAGPYLLAWLTVRHLDGVAPKRRWVLLTAAGLVLLNNAEFGIPAFAATVAALACERLRGGVRRLAVLAGEALGGLLGAAALVALLTLAHSGRLPDFGLLLEFPRLFGVEGWLLERMPTLGFQIPMYMTFGGALMAAAARVAGGADERPLTGMLAWSGAFGLLAGNFYVGRSDPLQLIVLLSAWCFALALLLVLVVRRLAARGWRRPALADLAVLFGFGLAVCSIPQIPTPWSQAARLQANDGAEPFVEPAAIEAIRGATRPGEAVALIVPTGHRIAYRLHLRNVVPYSGAEAMATSAQIARTVALVRRDRVHRVFVGIFDRSGGETVPSVVAAFRRAGFSLEATVGEVSVLSDRTRLAAAAPDRPFPAAPAHAFSAPDGDVANRRWVDGPIDAASVHRLRVAWRLPLPAGYAATPVVSGRTLYIQDLQSNVQAVDAASGRVLWTRTYEEADIGPNGVNVVGGRVFGATRTRAFALDARTGRELWNRFIALHTGDAIDMAPGYEDGVVYVSTSVQGPGAVGTLWALDAQSGAVRWRWAEVPEGLWGHPEVNAGGGLWHPPAFDGRGGLYAGIGNPLPFPGTAEEPWGSSRPGPNRWDNSLVKLDARTGRFEWGRQVVPHDVYDWDLECPPILVQAGGRELVLAAGKMGWVYAFDAGDGRLVWKRPVGRHNGHDHDDLLAMRGKRIHLPAKIWPGNWGGVETQMASDGRTVYVPVVDLWIRYSSQSDSKTQETLAGGGELVALDVASGRVRWIRPLPHSPYGAATVVNDLVFTTTYDGRLWAISTRTGAVVWSARLPAASYATVAASGDLLITAGNVAIEQGQQPALVAYRLGG